MLMEMQYVQFQMNKCGDNKNSCHKMKDLQNDERIIISYCEFCKKRFYVRKYEQRTDPTYGKLYRMDTLQPGSNLYYKYYGKMNVI